MHPLHNAHNMDFLTEIGRVERGKTPVPMDQQSVNMILSPIGKATGSSLLLVLFLLLQLGDRISL